MYILLFADGLAKCVPNISVTIRNIGAAIIRPEY